MAEFEVTLGSPFIKAIEIQAVRGKLRACVGVDNSQINIPCRVEPRSITKTCTVPRFERTAVCRAWFDFGYDDKGAVGRRERNELVTYQATAVLVGRGGGAGERYSSQAITFVALRRDAEKEDGLWRIPLPVWWHMDQPLSDWVDLSFVPDETSPGLSGRPRWNYWEFLEKAQGLLGKVFLEPSGLRYLEPLRDRIDRFNLWVTPWGGKPGDDGLCDFKLSRNIEAISSWMDATILLHNQKSARECSEIAGGGFGSTLVTSIEAPWIFSHELGHFLIAQSDEYCCEGGYVSDVSIWGIEANVFDSKPACEAGGTECRLIPASWRADVFRALDRRSKVPETMAFPIPLLPGEESEWGASTQREFEKVVPAWVPPLHLVKNLPAGLAGESLLANGGVYDDHKPDPYPPHREVTKGAPVAVILVNGEVGARQRIEFMQPLLREGSEEPDLVPATTTLRTEDLSGASLPWTNTSKGPQIRVRRERLFAREGAVPLIQREWVVLVPAVSGFNGRMIVEAVAGNGKREAPFLNILQAACRSLSNSKETRRLNVKGCLLLEGNGFVAGPN